MRKRKPLELPCNSAAVQVRTVSEMVHLLLVDIVGDEDLDTIKQETKSCIWHTKELLTRLETLQKEADEL